MSKSLIIRVGEIPQSIVLVWAFFAGVTFGTAAIIPSFVLGGLWGYCNYKVRLKQDEQMRQLAIMAKAYREHSK